MKQDLSAKRLHKAYQVIAGPVWRFKRIGLSAENSDPPSSTQLRWTEHKRQDV